MLIGLPSLLDSAAAGAFSSRHIGGQYTRHTRELEGGSRQQLGGGEDPLEDWETLGRDDPGLGIAAAQVTWTEIVMLLQSYRTYRCPRSVEPMQSKRLSGQNTEPLQACFRSRPPPVGAPEGLHASAVSRRFTSTRIRPVELKLNLNPSHSARYSEFRNIALSTPQRSS